MMGCQVFRSVPCKTCWVGAGKVSSPGDADRLSLSDAPLQKNRTGSSAHVIVLSTGFSAGGCTVHILRRAIIVWKGGGEAKAESSEEQSSLFHNASL